MNTYEAIIQNTKTPYGASCMPINGSPLNRPPQGKLPGITLFKQ